MKILVFSIQYDFQILKYQYQYSIWKILKQYQYLKNTEVSVFSISIFRKNSPSKTKLGLSYETKLFHLSLEKSPSNNYCHNCKWSIKAAKWNGVRRILQNIVFLYLILDTYLIPWQCTYKYLFDLILTKIMPSESDVLLITFSIIIKAKYHE